MLEGDNGLAPDFDFVYFVGPADFTKYFGFDDRADMEKLDAFYDGLAKTDPGISNVDKIKFRNYYALRASVSFSLGSHDEWNIVRAINDKRREADKQAGIVKQLGVFLEGPRGSARHVRSADRGRDGRSLPCQLNDHISPYRRHGHGRVASAPTAF